MSRPYDDEPPRTGIPETALPEAARSGSSAERRAAPRLVLRLVWAHTDGATCRDFSPGNAVVPVGRAHALDWHLDPQISRTHFELRREVGGGLTITDASSHGTAVNGRRIERNEPKSLRAGDVVRASRHLFTACLAEPDADNSPATDADGLLGQSQAIINIRREIEILGRAKFSILLQGETGSGKEVVACALHRAYGGDRPFVDINCATLNPELAASELFGHVRGAFTGADRSKDGVLTVADGGTLFLDEVAELPAPVQSQLLRAIETRSFNRLGEPEKKRTTSARFISATKTDIDAAIRAGRFRDDLKSRLAHATIRLPTLQQRREDIPLLATHFLDAYCIERHLQPLALEADQVERLLLASWPLNVRELRHRVEVAAELGARSGRVIFKGAAALAPTDTPDAPARPIPEPSIATTWPDWFKQSDEELRLRFRSQIRAGFLRTHGEPGTAAQAFVLLYATHGGKLETALEAVQIPKGSKRKVLTRLELSSDDLKARGAALLRS